MKRWHGKFQYDDTVKVLKTEFGRESLNVLTGAIGKIKAKTIWRKASPKNPIRYTVAFEPPIGPEKIPHYFFRENELEHTKR